MVGRGVGESVAEPVDVAVNVAVRVMVGSIVSVAVLVRRIMGVCVGTLATVVLPSVGVGEGATVGVTCGRPRPHPARINVSKIMMLRCRMGVPLCTSPL